MSVSRVKFGTSSMILFLPHLDGILEGLISAGDKVPSTKEGLFSTELS